MQTTFDTLPSFRETRAGYEYQSRNGEHLYLISWNSIDYDVTHFWAENPNGELIGQTTELSQAPAIARRHYAQLQK